MNILINLLNFFIIGKISIDFKILKIFNLGLNFVPSFSKIDLYFLLYNFYNSLNNFNTYCYYKLNSKPRCNSDLTSDLNNSVDTNTVSIIKYLNKNFPRKKSILKSILTLTKKRIKSKNIAFEMDLANDRRNPKILFSYINTKMKINSCINSITHNNSTFNNLTDIANILNNQFKSVFNIDSTTSNLPHFPPRSTHTTKSFDISFDSVYNLLMNLDHNK